MASHPCRFPWCDLNRDQVGAIAHSSICTSRPRYPSGALSRRRGTGKPSPCRTFCSSTTRGGTLGGDWSWVPHGADIALDICSIFPQTRRGHERLGKCKDEAPGNGSDACHAARLLVDGTGLACELCQNNIIARHVAEPALAEFGYPTCAGFIGQGAAQVRAAHRSQAGAFVTVG